TDDNFFVGASLLNTYFKNTEWRFEPGLRYDFGSDTRLAVGADVAQTFAEGNSLAHDVRRITYGAYTSVEQKLFGGGEIINGILVYPSLRFDAVRTGTTTLSSWSPQLGVVVPFVEISGFKPTLRVNVSRNFAVPTFNMLFFAGGGGMGNPNLLPERSTGFDVGMNADARWWGKHALQVSYFNIAMTDRIVWISSGGPNVTPKNIRSVRSSGIEMSYRWEPVEDFLILSATYTSSSTRKSAGDFAGDRNVNTQLVYVPQETGTASASISRKFDNSFLSQLGGTVALSYTGFRYTTEDNLNFLPSYMVVNCNLRATIALLPVRYVVRLEVNNLFDKEYQTIVSYPMPGRSFRIALGVEY
ncbi:MAG: TonB-dependent receptor, partial [bacterium]